MRIYTLLPVFLGIAACSAQVPDSAAGVGFNDYSTYQNQQAAASVPPAAPVSQQPLATTAAATSAPLETTALASGQSAAQTTLATNTAAATGQADSGASLAADTQAALAASSTTTNTGRVVVEANPNNPPPQTVTTSTGISQENDFDRVGELRSIESDAELLAQNRAQYQVVQPTSLPTRENVGPNIVEYALSTKHPVGTKVWNRIGFNKQAKFQRNCAQYASPDKAQAAFLERGGPNRDRLGLDPDGDGYACAWNPRALPPSGAGLTARRHPSPNHGARRESARPDMIVLHHTAMQSCEAALARLCDPDAEVSCHYLISEAGQVLQLVEEAQRAWHAGAGRWGSVSDVNSRSIGIELANTSTHPYPEPQMAALEALLPGIMARWHITPERVIAHSDMAPDRKSDPGPRFDWRRLALQGLSVWPDAGCGEGDFTAFAKAFGYTSDVDNASLLAAFRLRFRPWAQGPEDATDRALAANLAQRFPVDRAEASA